MTALFAHPWRFVTSAPTLAALPPEGPPEVAFAGRSNVGKSTLINALTGTNALARTSNTPGRTQALNFFAPEMPGPGGRWAPDTLPPLAIVDMPGFGYAKAPRPQIESWTRLMRRFVTGRSTLRRVFMLVDARHGLKPNDLEMLSLLDEAAVSYQIVLTKADKIKPLALERRIAEIREAIVRRPAAHPEVLATSAVAGTGIDALRTAIEDLCRP